MLLSDPRRVDVQVYEKISPPPIVVNQVQFHSMYQLFPLWKKREKYITNHNELTHCYVFVYQVPTGVLSIHDVR